MSTNALPHQPIIGIEQAKTVVGGKNPLTARLNEMSQSLGSKFQLLIGGVQKAAHVVRGVFDECSDLRDIQVLREEIAGYEKALQAGDTNPDIASRLERAQSQLSRASRAQAYVRLGMTPDEAYELLEQSDDRVAVAQTHRRLV